MNISIEGAAQDRRILRNALNDVRRLIAASDALPAAKKRALNGVLDDPQWTIRADLPFGGRLNGVTFKSRKLMRVSLNTFAGGINRFRAVIFHELVHASCEGEFDAEVFECLLFPPSNNLPGGGTWPRGDDLDPFENGTSARGDGLRESDHFIWDPATGRVWRRNPDGSRGPIAWDDPDIWDRWKTTRRLSRAVAADTTHEVFIDTVQPGDYGYSALDEVLVQPPLDELIRDDEDPDTGSGDVARRDFVEFSSAEGGTPLSVRASHVAKVLPDGAPDAGVTRIRLKDGDEFRVKATYADVMLRLH